MQFISDSEIYGCVSSLELEEGERERLERDKWEARMSEWKGSRAEMSVDGTELLQTW